VAVTDKDHETIMIVKAWCMVVAWFEVIKQAAYPRLKMPTTVLMGSNWGLIDNEDKFEASYSVEGTYEQYLQFKDVVTSGTILQNMHLFTQKHSIKRWKI
jgi:hypothetical protein